MIRKFFLFFALCFALPQGFAQELIVQEAKPGGVYGIGEKIIWGVLVKDGPGIEKVSYVLRKGQLTEIGKGEITLNNGVGEIETKLDEPGTILAEFSIAPE